MKTLQIPATNRTPKVMLNSDTGILEFKGISTSENIILFFEPILDWVITYVENKPTKITTINLSIEYLNTGASKKFLHIINTLLKLKKYNSELVINWHYEDEDIYDLGNDFQTLLNTSFNFIKNN